MIQTKRFDFIDTAKGIGISLVVWSHMSTTTELTGFYKWGGYITTFYMPLFFILSGLFYRPVNIIQRLKNLLVPYFCFYVLAYLAYILKSILKYEDIEWSNFFVPFFGGTIGYQNSPIWFLLSLSQISILAIVFVKYMNKIIGFIVAFILAYLASCCKGYFDHVPYYIDVSLISLPFFLIGYYYKEQILQKIRVEHACCFAVLSVFFYILSPEFTNVSQNYLPQGYILYFVVSMMASLSVIGFCKYIRGYASFILGFLGENSLIILCSHMIVISLGSIHIPHTHIVLMNFLGLTAILSIEYLIINFINKHMRWLLAKRAISI